MKTTCRIPIMSRTHGFISLAGLLLISIVAARADTAVVFNEVMYHPITNEPTMEWIELRNQLAVDVDISSWSIAGGVAYTFPSNTIVRGGGFALVAVSPDALKAALGNTNVLGPFLGRLSNNGDRLELRNNSGRVVDEVSYGVDGDWPVAPDGSGASLAKRDRDSASGPAENWTWSEQLGGTPGAENFAVPGAVQPDIRLIAVDATWKYEASGADLGAAWRAAGYNDAAWGSQAALTNRTIPGLFNTGVGANGVVLANGVSDPHYILTAAAQGTVGANALAILNHPAWLANDAASSFIGVVNPGATSISGGNYNFQTTFSLAGFISSTVRININVAVDNDLTDVFINGAGSGFSTSGFAAFNPTLVLASGFVGGVNTLEFRTVNQGAGAGGFRATLGGTGLSANTNSPLPLGLATYYFRKTFAFAGDPAYTELRLNSLIADGAVVYLNGVEVYRQNMPAGAVAYATPASSNVAAPDYSGLVQILAGSLVAGVNVLAVEVHQAAGSADGPLYGADLIATPLPVPATPPVTMAFNEFSAATNAEFWLELVNYGTNSLSLDGYVLVRDGATNSEYVFPAGPALGQGAYVALTNTTLGFHPVSGDKLYLLPPARNKVIDAVVIKNRLRGRSPDATGPWLWPDAPTPGAANSFAFRTELVINEIMYNAHPLAPTNNLPPQSSPEAWIEIFNRSTNTVDLTGWEIDGGVQYNFTPGKTLAPGAYLVIADDVPFLKSLHPSIDIVGDFGGRLSGRSDRIVLKDPTGNPADEVRYFDGGRWPGYADGGGSSLELRDPNSDNSKAEAWAASDESGKSAWQTFTYRAVAQQIPYTRLGSTLDNQWRDLVFGLLDAGECLIDDLSVIESPASAPAQVIANGNFENGLTGWRVLGTHGRSLVEPEPGNPGNKVLHLIATGPQEHMHNHIETTLIAGKTITNGREYEVSFRARLLAGNNLLNTRLYFNRAGRTTALPMPALNGTPGAQNSRFAANIGPTFSDFAHQKVVPAAGEAVTVSVTAHDPQGIASAQVFWSVNSGSWNNAAMTSVGGGRYQGTIPGQSEAAVVQFYVRATDTLGATATFPARGPDSGALYKVQDGQANLNLAHNVRIILTPANIDLMHGTAQGVNQTNVMSNDLLPCTVVYDEKRVYYDCAVHLRGSQRGRYSDIRTGFHIEFPPDDLFRGVHPVMLIDRSGAGDATANRQEEIVLKHILNRAGGIPGTYSEICRLLAPRSVHTGPAQFFPRHEDVFIESAFPNGGDGTMFEMELIYWPLSANAAGYKNPQSDDVTGLDISDLTDDKEIYRYNFMIKNHREVDDYRPFVALAKSWSLSGAALDAQTRQLMDINQWMRAYALVSLCSVGDMYTFGNNHNFFAYLRPSDGKFLYFPWDMDFAFTRGSSGALVGDQNLARIVNLPGNLRLMYAHMLDIIGVSFNTAYMTYWTDHYDNFAPGQSYAGSLSTIGARVTFVQNTINTAGGNAAFAVSGTNFITTSNNLVTLSGTAPVQVQTIKVNGRDYAVTWNSISGWTLRVPVSDPTNTLVVEAFNLAGAPLTNRTITVNYTGATPDPAGAVVINEIMYNPTAPDAAYVELFNTASNFTFDLSDWRINGLDYTFPKGSVISNRQHLLLAGNAPAFIAAFGSNAPTPSSQFSGNLQNDGETLTLIRPGAAPGQEIEMDKVRYESAPPWPASANGTGPSLQLVDPFQDNSRVANWSDGSGWRYVSVTGVPSGGQNKRLMLWLDTAGRVNLDDMFLALGRVPEVGSNYINNGGFEAPLAPYWTTNGNNAANSTTSTAIKRSGDSSMELVFASGGSSGQYLYYNLTNAVTPDFNSTSNYTLSFWYLPTTNANKLTARLGTPINPTLSVRPIIGTPGAANSVAQSLPAFPPLWLNEVQAENINGITDTLGAREPWVELVNVSSNTVSLDGLFLSDNYSNLAQWSFPPGASLAPGEFQIIFADGEPAQTTAGEWHASFRLAPAVGAVALSRTFGGAAQIVDYLNYTNLPAGRSYGDYPDAQPFFRQEFFIATPGAPNDNTAPPLVAFINEWMAANTRTLLNTNNGNRYDDWFELYNPGGVPASLDGYYLTDNLSNQIQFAIPPGFVIPAHGFLLVWADNAPGLNNTNISELHVSFRLGQNGEQIGLFASDGTMIDGVTFEPQFDDFSQGRYPDGTGPVYFLATPTPRAPNSAWANRYPVLPFIADATNAPGQTLSFNAGASDPDSPPQILSYSLDAGFPTGAVVHATSGLFSWTPTLAQAPSTNLITLRVSDNGTPALSAARTFRVVVRQELRVSGITSTGGGNLDLTFGTIPGRSYRVDYKNALEDPQWLPLTADTPATGISMTMPISMAGQQQRFYRIVQVN